MNKKYISLLLMSALAFSANVVFGKNIRLKNNSYWPIKYKFAWPQEFAMEHELPKGKSVMIDENEKLLHIRRSGLGTEGAKELAKQTGTNLQWTPVPMQDLLNEGRGRATPQMKHYTECIVIEGLTGWYFRYDVE